jgi:hypothetical protein
VSCSVAEPLAERRVACGVWRVAQIHIHTLAKRDLPCFTAAVI